ncbi:MAG: NRDE family protein, partial [Deltaproteobacteria bacterium]
MCLFLLAYKQHHQYPIIVAGNRDEFYTRPTAPMRFWDYPSNILAGKDLQDGGTWFGITKNGNICAITNYREMNQIPNATSRGWIAKNFLTNNHSCEQFFCELELHANQYNGFNFIAGNVDSIYYYSNRNKQKKSPVKLQSGVYALSNHLLDTPWYKVLRSKKTFTAQLQSETDIDFEQIFFMLADRQTAIKEELPNTGVGTAWEEILSSVFVNTIGYGTRTSYVLTIDYQNRVSVVERTYNEETKLINENSFDFIFST